jgi:hypothetical protein
VTCQKEVKFGSSCFKSPCEGAGSVETLAADTTGSFLSPQAITSRPVPHQGPRLSQLFRQFHCVPGTVCLGCGFWAALGFELRASGLLGGPLALVIFQIACTFLPRVILGSQSSSLRLLHSWDYRCAPSHPAVGCDGVWVTFSPAWTGTAILPLSASQVAGITGGATVPGWLVLVTNVRWQQEG